LINITSPYKHLANPKFNPKKDVAQLQLASFGPQLDVDAGWTQRAQLTDC